MFLRPDRTKTINMIPKSLICLVWAASFAISSSVNSPNHSVTAVASSYVVSTTPGNSVATFYPQKRANVGNQTCDPSTMSWYDMVKAYSNISQQALTDYLKATPEESNLMLTRDLTMVSSPYDPNRVFCKIFPKASNDSGTSFPKCLLEAAVDDFCTVSKDTWMNKLSPYTTNSKGGRWKTYKFADYSISGLCVGVEFSKVPECDGHWRGIHFYDNTPDKSCRDKLLREVVDRCTSPQHRPMVPVQLSGC